MKELADLFASNKQWAASRKKVDPMFFEKTSSQHTPKYLWIGCADSRVPANEIVGLDPGDMFVHRNIANVVVHTDLNCLSVIQYAVEVLRIEHIIVCGHYGCGGIQAAASDGCFGLIDNWLCHVKDIRRMYSEELEALPDDQARLGRLCELNIIEQVLNVGRTSIAIDAWARGRHLAIHGWIYSLTDGILQDLGVCINSPDALADFSRRGNPTSAQR